MGELNVFIVENKAQRKELVRAILTDMNALDEMLERDMFEKGVVRIGAEQEMCFVDKHCRPSNIGLEVLENIDDKHFTTELAQFNLEANLDPQEFSGDALKKMRTQLEELMAKAERLAQERGSHVLLTGILPTIRKEDLEFENITPYERYRALNEAMRRQRGGDFEFYIKGTDELITKHNTMLFEACNTSFQIHLQLDSDQFVDKYNWAQLIAGPVLAASTNSPLLFNKRLWEETRIAVFEQTVDLKNVKNPDREQKSRVDFGNGWLKESVTELFKNDIAYYKLLLGSEIQEDSLEVLKQGGCPKLKALSLFNGTIYKWNRACYGITNGKPHLRIENRYIPSGPTVVDEIANATFWLGLMEGMPSEIQNIEELIEFDHVKHNFLKAAQLGLSTQFKWIDGKRYTAEDLIINTLIPISRKGLESRNIDEDDIELYLTIIEERVRNHQTGSNWINKSYDIVRKGTSPSEAVVAITSAMIKRQATGRPCHEWDLAQREDAGSWAAKYKYVKQVMSTELYTVQDEDVIDLCTSVMDWRKIHHVPVENEEGEVVGIISSEDILRYYTRRTEPRDGFQATVNQIMNPNPIVVVGEMLTTDALRLMRSKNIGCLPVVKNKKLIGILTEFDFVHMAEHLFEELEKIEAKNN
jgi:CBS domain-containing protein